LSTNLLSQRIASVPIDETNYKRGEEREKEAADMHEHAPGFFITHRHARLWSIWRIGPRPVSIRRLSPIRLLTRVSRRDPLREVLNKVRQLRMTIGMLKN